MELSIRPHFGGYVAFMMRSFIVAFVLFPALAFAQGLVPPNTDSRVVVELYTSQACSYCPKANEMVTRLARERDDVTALTLPVGYWDYKGWADPFADAAHLERQEGYVEALPNRQVFTPQIVIAGAANFDTMKSYDDFVAQVLAHKAQAPALSVRKLEDGAFMVSLPDAAATAASQQTPADVWLIPYAPGDQSTKVKRGGNRGKTIVYTNVAKGARKLGQWSGEAAELRFSMDDDAPACAILVQAAGMGPILASLDMPAGQ